MGKNILVDLRSQSVVARDGTVIFHGCECVSGDANHPTPTGRFTVIRMHHPYVSSKYKVPMDYALFFTTTGVALHQYHGPAPWWLLRAGRAATLSVRTAACG